MSDDLLERLLAVTDDATVNPDGPEAATRIAELEAALRYANEYAGRLALTLAKKHYPTQPFELLPYLLGRIDQIDNMICGLTRIDEHGQSIREIRAALEGKKQ
jgi:hypothetical protein